MTTFIFLSLGKRKETGDSNTLGIRSSPTVTVTVKCVCAKNSISIQSDWSLEARMNLKTEFRVAIHCLFSSTLDLTVLIFLRIISLNGQTQLGLFCTAFIQTKNYIHMLYLHTTLSKKLQKTTKQAKTKYKKKQQTLKDIAYSTILTLFSCFFGSLYCHSVFDLNWVMAVYTH